METNFSLNHAEYIERNKLLAEENAFSGKALLEWHKSCVWHSMIYYFGPTQWIDYGCGPAFAYQEGQQMHQVIQETNSKQPILYDPCHPPYDTFPTVESVPGVVCVDVLEHIPESDTVATLDYLFNVCSEWMFLFISTKKGARGFINHHESTHCTLKTRQEWVDIVDEYATAKGIPVVLATDYVGDTFEHNGKGFTYDHWNMPQLLVTKIKGNRENFYKYSPEHTIDYPWDLTNSNFDV
tara:strand:- start:844 stop:1560 length:717 start_codon:yes stop_codon:yes gene_type:complete